MENVITTLTRLESLLEEQRKCIENINNILDNGIR